LLGEYSGSGSHYYLKEILKPRVLGTQQVANDFIVKLSHAELVSVSHYLLLRDPETLTFVRAGKFRMIYYY